MSHKYTAVTLSILLLTACATHRYGRQLALTPTEREALTCEQIQIEIEKCNAFLAEVNSGAPAGRQVLAVLGDFGIGNSMEQQDARESGKTRLDELIALKAERQCP